MGRYKVFIDVLMGAVIPIVILNWFSGPLTAPVAYVVSALIPVSWVLIDLAFITKRFNFITSYTGISAIARGALAFWFVDGILFAIKDTLGIVLTVLIFGVSVAIGKPILQYFLLQGLNPPSAKHEGQLKELIHEPSIFRRFILGTLAFTVLNIALAILNFYLNLNIVVAEFGTETFNQQVAEVNTIMRIVGIVELVLLVGVFLYAVMAVYARLPVEPGKSPWESDFWELMRRRDEQPAENPNP